MKLEKGKYGQINQPGAMEIFGRIPDDDTARLYLESGRWPNGITCIHCHHDEVWKIRKGKLYTCKSCRKQFTIRTGTVMEDSKIPLKKWIFAMHLMTVGRKAMSSTQLAKEIGVTQKSAWFMAYRIRESLREERKGTYHKWSKKHLFRYVNEFMFEASTKELPAFDIEGKDCGTTTVRAHMAGMKVAV